MILVDTNILYVLAGLENNSRIDACKLNRFFAGKAICISPITVFEILNSKHFKTYYSFIILKAIDKCGTVSFVGNNFYDSYFGRGLFTNLEKKTFEDQKKAYKTISHFIVDLYSYFYGNLLVGITFSYFLIFDYLDDFSNDSSDNFDKRIQSCYDLLFEKVFDYIKRTMSTLLLHECFTEAERNKYFSYIRKALLFDFRFVLNDCVISLEKKIFTYDKMFNKINAVIKKIDFDKTINNPKFNGFDAKTFDDYISSGGQIKKTVIDQIVDKITDIFTKSDCLFNSVTDIIYMTFFKAFLKAGFKKTSNDILDASLFDVVRDVRDSKIIDSVATLDVNFGKVLKKFAFDNIKIYTSDDFE